MYCLDALSITLSKQATLNFKAEDDVPENLFGDLDKFKLLI
jgi:hypothetical protein